MNLNKVYIIGRLTADPEYRTTQTGQDVTNLRVATNRIWNDPSGNRQESTEYHSVVAWGKLAQIAKDYLAKGRMVMIEGRMQTRSWDNPNGFKQYKTEIVAENLQLGPRTGSAETTSYTPKTVSAKQQTGTSNPNKQDAENSPIKEEDIPIINEDTVDLSDTDEDKKIDLSEIPF